jgi:CRISPR-associated protein Cmr2
MKYIAITIGPIVDTLLKAKKVKELWASSYLFSFMMKGIVTKINQERDIVGEVLLPVTDGQPAKNGAGLYPDRIYIKAENNDSLERVHQIIDEQIRGVGKTNKHGNIIKINPLKDFFKIYAFMVEIQKDGNIIEELSAYCDTIELQNRIDNDQAYNVILKELLNICESPILVNDAVDNKAELEIESLIDISTKNFKLIEESKYLEIVNERDRLVKSKNIDDEKFMIDRLKQQFPGKFKARHKYFAMVHADGDNIGKIINHIGVDPNEIKAFSRSLYSFAKEATNIIKSQGGVPIYMGGDDMLFLAPIICGKKDETQEKQYIPTSIFHLIKDLDQCFDEILIKEYIDKKNFLENKKPSPSMSYGIAISHHKYPLYEVRNSSYEQLQYVKTKCKDKNAVQVFLQKHSGAKIDFLLSKNNVSYESSIFSAFNRFIDSCTGSKGIADDNGELFLNSFTHKLETLVPFLEEAVKNRERLRAFFEYNFNENFESYSKFYSALEEYILEVYKNTEDKDQRRKTIEGALRFLHFIYSEDKE